MYPDSSEGLNKETSRAVYFFTPAFYPLDNFSAHRVEIWEIKFPTAEHAYQWKKFCHNHDLSCKILDAPSPEAANKYGKQNKSIIPEGWHKIKQGIMKEILRAKAEQNEDVREALIRSGSREIIENSPIDDYWGSGPANDGQNIVGKIWMEIRSELYNSHETAGEKNIQAS